MKISSTIHTKKVEVKNAVHTLSLSQDELMIVAAALNSVGADEISTEASAMSVYREEVNINQARSLGELLANRFRKFQRHGVE